MNPIDILESNLIVTPNEDLSLGESLKDERKLFAARALSTFFRRLDQRGSDKQDLTDIPQNLMPLTIGLRMENNRISNIPAAIPLTQINNCDINGSTGSGKSCLERVFAEAVSEYNDVNILLISPRNQDVGLRLPQDQQSILSQYSDFGMKPSSARPYKCFKYFAPGQSFGEKLPKDLSVLGRSRSIVCLKWLQDDERCSLFSKILDAIFEYYSYEESELVRLAIFIDEAQLFTKRRVPKAAKEAATKAEISLDRFVREIRKYGGCVFIVSQSIKDFAYESSGIRQNCNTKAFLTGGDQEAEYATPFLGNSRELMHLPPQSVIIHNSAWGVIRLKVRPPRSKVWEFSPEATRNIVSSTKTESLIPSDQAQHILEIVKAHRRSTGEGINLSAVAQKSGITSKRRIQQLIDELERGGHIKTRRLLKRGLPRIVEPISNGGAD